MSSTLLTPDVGQPGAEQSRPPGQAAAAGQWYAVWTRSRHEAAVLHQLQERGVESFLPTLPKWSRWKDRKKRIDWPLFPGYCFVHIDPSQSLTVRKCSGVVGLVTFESRPAPIPAHEIESIRTLVGSSLRYDPCPLIHEGMRVEVRYGPLKGVVGQLVRKGSHARLILSVELIGRGVSVEVDAADVQAIG